MPEVRTVIEPDEDLLRRVCAGDAAAFAALVDRHQRRVRLLCWRITGSFDEAQDLTQEVWVRVHHHRASYQPGKPLTAWLQRIAVNVCLTFNERMRRRLPVCALEEDEDTPVLAPAADPAQLFAEAAGADGVQRVVERLAEPFRTTFVLRVFGELTYQEIANELNCSLGTVMSRINRARQHLKSHLKDVRP